MLIIYPSDSYFLRFFYVFKPVRGCVYISPYVYANK